MKVALLSCILLFVFSSCTDKETPESCGDNIVDIGEECDGVPSDGDTCQTNGYYAGELSCDENCRFVFTDCEIHGFCGDGIIQGDFEDCDGSSLAGAVCEGEDIYGGEMACDDSCNFDDSGCQRCGDGVLQAEEGEECDGDEFGGNDCSLYNKYMGSLTCSSQCTVSGVDCIGECGDGVFQSDFEECEGSELNGETCSTLGAFGGTLTCGTDCNYNRESCSFFVQYGGSGLDEGISLAVDESTGDLRVLIKTNDLPGSSPIGKSDFGMALYDFAGFKTTESLFGTTENDYPFAIAYDDEGNWYMAGDTYGDLSGGYHPEKNVLVYKMSDYDEIWTSYFNIPSEERLAGMVIGSGNEIFLAGSREEGGETDNFLMKITPFGDQLVDKTWGCPGAMDNITSVTMGPNNTVCVTGFTEGTYAGYTQTARSEVYVACLSAEEIVLWQYQSEENTGAEGFALVSGEDGSLYVTGYTDDAMHGSTPIGMADVFVMKFDESGTVVWTTMLGTGEVDLSTGITIGSDGNILVTGWSFGAFPGYTNSGESDIFLSKVTTDGTKIWTRQWGTSGLDSATDIIYSPSKGVVITGGTAGQFAGVLSGDSDYFLLYTLDTP